MSTEKPSREEVLEFLKEVKRRKDAAEVEFQKFEDLMRTAKAKNQALGDPMMASLIAVMEGLAALTRRVSNDEELIAMIFAYIGLQQAAEEG